MKSILLNCQSSKLCLQQTDKTKGHLGIFFFHLYFYQEQSHLYCHVAESLLRVQICKNFQILISNIPVSHLDFEN